MWRDDLRGIFYIALKDLRAYYLKPPNISWGILFPGALTLAFYVRNPGGIRELAPGLLAMTALFSATSMEAIVITFERRVGALERLLLAPISLPALLAGKVLGGVVFGLTITTVVAAVAVIGWGAPGLNPLALALALVLSTAVFSALGALVSVAVREVFEAQTLANFIRFPMIFLCGVFVPLASLPPALRAVAHGLPLTYAVRAIQQALFASDPLEMALDLAILAAFAAGLFLVAARVLARRLE